MKKSYILFAAALSIMSWTGCSVIPEIETEVNEEQEVVAAGKLLVTGTINKDPETRVSLADEGTSITPSWEIGDQVFGFWGDNTLTYEVASVSNGMASFTLVDGTEPEDGTTVHMIYAPAKSASDLANGQLEVDLSQQDGTLAGLKNHAIMCATATVDGSRLSLQFENQVAIVGVKQFTGLKAGTTYTSATFTTAGTSGTIQLVEDVLTFVPDEIYGTITATGSFVADASGNTNSTIYFAVPSTTAVAHTFALHSTSDHRAGTLSPKAITAGKYLYMNNKAMTKTVFFDDFEDTAENTFPASLSIYHNGTGSGNQKVITSEKKNGSKALHLQGSSGWSANITQNGTFEFDGVETYIMECYMYQVNETGTANGGMGFAQLYGSGGNHTATLGWQSNGWEYTSGSGRDQYAATNETGKWYHLKIVCDFNTNHYDIYVDGILIAGGVTMNNVTPTFILLAAGNGGTNNVYFDDVMVYTKPHTPDNISNYILLDYIQSTAAQYINTRVKPNENTKVELFDFCASPSEDWAVYIGATTDDGDPTTWWIRKESNNSSICSGIGNVKTSPYYNYLSDYTLGTTIGKLSLDNTGLYVNDVKATGPQYQNSITPGSNPLYIFAGNSNGSAWRYSSMRISGCKIYNGTDMIRDFVPAQRKSDKKLGLYDKVENRFYPNLGTKEFIKPGTNGSASVNVEAGITENTVKWVQLWENGPKFAEMNIGAIVATALGGSYSWSESGNGDVANTNWGSAWRVPTEDELSELMLGARGDESAKVTCRYAQYNGAWGFLFNGKNDYESNTLFLPSNHGGVWYGMPYGGAYYWSGTPDGSKGWAMMLNYDNWRWNSEWQLQDKGNPYYVRAVLAE